MSDSHAEFPEEVYVEIETNVDVGILLETIQRYEFIYNMGHPEYKNAKKNNLAWEDIALIVNHSVAECQRSWKSLRDRFTKEKNKMRSVSEAPESNWVHFNSMLFYSKFSKPRKTYTSTKPPIKEPSVEKQPSRPSTTYSVWSAEETIFSPVSSVNHSIEDDSRGTPSPTIEKSKSIHTPTLERGVPKKRRRTTSKSFNETEGILDLVKSISANLQSVTSTPVSNSNRAFADYIYMRLDEMNPEVAASKRLEIFHVLES